MIDLKKISRLVAFSCALTVVALFASGCGNDSEQASASTEEDKDIVAALEASAWKVAGENGAARLLGLKHTTLASRIKSMDIHRPLADR